MAASSIVLLMMAGVFLLTLVAYVVLTRRRGHRSHQPGELDMGDEWGRGATRRF